MSDNDSFFSAMDSDSSYSDSVSDQVTLSTCIAHHFSQRAKFFNVCHLNAQSVPQHFSELYDIFSSKHLHAILISESWLQPSYASNFCSLPGYVLLRNDRIGKRGGGVAIYLRSEIPYKILVTSPSQYSGSIEYMMIEVIICGVKVVLGVIYCPPNVTYFNDLDCLLFSLCSEYAHHIIMGDFNTDLLKNNQRSRELRSIVDSVNFSILKLNPTHHNINTEDTWIDLIVVACPDLVADHGQFSVPGVSRHDMVHVSYKIKPPKPQSQTIYIRSFAKINSEKLSYDASLLDWSNVFDCSSVDGKVEALNECICSLYDKHAPIHAVKVKRPPSPWITAEIRLAMNRRDKAFRRFKKNRCEDNWCLFKGARNRCNQMVRAAKRRYIHSNILNSSSADVWKFLNTLSVIQPTCNVSYQVSANDLNVHFSSASILDNSVKLNTIANLSSVLGATTYTFNFSPVTDVEIRKIIVSIKSRAVGCDQLGRDMILPIIEYVLPCITHIINFSLLNSVFPTIWRNAYVLPLPKVSNPCSLNQFRPISILPFLSKVLEAAVHKQVVNYIANSNFLSSFQSGFRPGHSTTTALLKVTGDVRVAMEDSKVTVLVLIDFSNAFNVVDHDILIAILAHLGFSLPVQDWFSSYIRGRRQAVRTNGSLSDWCNLSAGVPQGGILSPLLFSIFINSITSTLNCSYHLYADDLQLYIHTDISNINNAICIINSDLQMILKWSSQFGIAVNPNKCQSIIIGSSRRLANLDLKSITEIKYNNVTIPFLHQVKNLGLIVDSSLSWVPQVNEVCRKINASLRSLYRHKHFLPTCTKLLLVQTLVLPILDYADVCYSELNQVLLDKLDRLLNNCIRFIFGLRKYDHISYYRLKLKWLPIRQRRNLRILITLFSILFDPCFPNYIKSQFKFLDSTHNLQLRSADNLILHVPLFRTDFLSNSFTGQAIRLWNALPTDIKNASSKFSFKRLLKSHLSV